MPFRVYHALQGMRHAVDWCPNWVFCSSTNCIETATVLDLHRATLLGEIRFHKKENKKSQYLHWLDGVPEGARTLNIRIHSAVLCH